MKLLLIIIEKYVLIKIKTVVSEFDLIDHSSFSLVPIDKRMNNSNRFSPYLRKSNGI